MPWTTQKHAEHPKSILGRSTIVLYEVKARFSLVMQYLSSQYGREPQLSTVMISYQSPDREEHHGVEKFIHVVSDIIFVLRPERRVWLWSPRVSLALRAQAWAKMVRLN